jgi:hypothetical protein
MKKEKPRPPMSTEARVFFGLFSALLVFCLSWLVLDHFRGQFYDTSIIGGPSPYLAILQLQKAIRWAIYVLAAASIISAAWFLFSCKR